MNSPYSKHLDATLDRPSVGTSVASHTTALPAVPSASSQPLVVQAPDSGGNKAAWMLIAIVLAAVAAVAGWAWASFNGPTWGELRRYEALAGREGEIRGRDQGWAEGRGQGRTEMQYLAKYERLRNQAQSFTEGWRAGLGIGQEMGSAKAAARYGYGRYGRYGYGRGYGYGYGGYYGGRVSNAIASAQSIANMTGSPVDVIID